MEFSLQVALSLSRLKPELHAWFGGQPRSSGMEFSLQAALSLSRLKPELHACFGGQTLPILGASSVKKAFTSSHDRGINISGVGSFSASLKYVQRYLAEEYGRRAPRRKRIWERALVRTDHFFDLILAERC